MCFLTHKPFVFIRPVFSVLALVSVEIFAQSSYPSCIPMESSWDNIELVTELNTVENEIMLAVSMLGNSLQHYYGFAFLNNDQHTLPTAKQSIPFFQYFSRKTLLALQEKTMNKEGDRLYGFKPVEHGHWMIYLVASLYPIDFLEQKQLQIQPNIESERGGTVFTGSSLNLVEPIDYKVCMIRPAESASIPGID